MVKRNNTNIYLDASILHDGRLRQAQLKMLDILNTVDEICRKHQLDYWLDRGSLLGAIRHQGFIPWDDDIDIAMPRDSYETFLRIAPNELPSHLWAQTKDTDPGYFNLAAPLKIRDLNSRFIEKHETGNETYQQGIFIDVFAYDVMPENTFKRKLYKLLGKKLLRLLSYKYSTVKMGHYAKFYQRLSNLIPKSLLNKQLNYLIQTANRDTSLWLGYGYDSTKKMAFRHDEIYPLKRVVFETSEFNVANHAEIILNRIYGDYLTPPPAHRQRPNHCRELIPDLISN